MKPELPFTPKSEKGITKEKTKNISDELSYKSP